MRANDFRDDFFLFSKKEILVGLETFKQLDEIKFKEKTKKRKSFYFSKSFSISNSFSEKY